MKTSVLAAYVARELSKEIGFEEPGVAYTGGIFAQIGRLALLEDEGETYVDLWFEEQDRSASFRGPPPQGQGILHFEEDYVQNGLAVGQACGVSDKLQAVLRAHHRPARARTVFRPLVPLVAVAFTVAHHAGDLEATPAYLRQLRAVGIGFVAAGIATLAMERNAADDADDA